MGKLTLKIHCFAESRFIGWLIAATTLCLLMPAAVAAEEQDLEKEDFKFVEPIITEETMPNDPGELTLRVTTEYAKHGSEKFGLLPNIQVFYGLVERLGAELSVPLAYHAGERTDYGIGDISVALKYLVVEPVRNWPAVVVGVEAGFPTGSESRELGEGAYELTPFVALLKDFGPFTVQGNFGWSKQVSAGRVDRFVYNWALAIPVLEKKVHLLAEINGDWGREQHAAFTPGIKYNFTDEMFVGVAVPLGLNENTPDWGVVTQFQIGF
jgi:hypothetical protein